MIIFRKKFSCLKTAMSECSYLSGFLFLSTRLINPHHALCTLIIKVTFLLRERHSLRIHAGRNHPPTFIHWSHLDRFIIVLSPFLS